MSDFTIEGVEVFWDFDDHRDNICYECETSCSGYTLCECCLNKVNFPEVHKAFELTLQANKEGKWEQANWLEGEWVTDNWNEPATLCGTSACLAGNYVLGTLSDKEYARISTNYNAFLDLRCEIQDKATTALGLSEYAAEALFRADNSLDDIEWLINHWVKQADKAAKSNVGGK